MNHRRIAAFCFVVWTISQAYGGVTEIGGSGTGWTWSAPVRGSHDYNWSQTIYLESEIGAPCVITGLSVRVGNDPVDFVMDNQQIFLKQTTTDAFTDANYDDPAASGFAEVFQGTITWNGSGWHHVPLAAPFVYHGGGNLIVCWENRDGSGAAGYPKFHYFYGSNRTKYNQADGSFPGRAGRKSPNNPALRIHWSARGPWDATDPHPYDQEVAVAVDAIPTLSWSNRASCLRNAVYFSSNQTAVANTALTARVLHDGVSVYSNYTHGAALSRRTTYYWRVVQETAETVAPGRVWPFSTEDDPIDEFPWREAFESGGVMPSYWHPERSVGTTPWQFQAGGDGTPSAAHEGTESAVFIGSGGARTMLVTPVLDLSGTASDPLLVFWRAQGARNGSQDELRVYYRTSQGGAWNLVPGAEYTADTPEWTREAFRLPSPSDTYYVGFEGLANGGAGVCVDSVEILTEYTSVTLDVYDCNGDSLGAAPFRVYVPAGAALPTEQGETARDGMADLFGLAPGTIRYVVDEAFHNAAGGTLTVGAGDSVTQRVDLVAATHLEGVVREKTPDGARVEGAVVDLHSPAPESRLIASDTTDTFGRYHLSHVSNGDYELTATHPAYEDVNTGITVTASASHVLVMDPLDEKLFNVHVQVQGALSGYTIVGASIALSVTASGGGAAYQQTLVTDNNGYVCFRGVPEGAAHFSCDPLGTREWWESYRCFAGEIANDKMVTVRLAPKKSSVKVRLTFDPATPMGFPLPVAPFVQNFWVEARGYDPVADDWLYPARTELSKYDGSVTFEALPALPTRISIRRPGFAVRTAQLTPDENGEFPKTLDVARPVITPGTTWDLAVDQPLLTKVSAPGAPPSSDPGYQLVVEGIPTSNTEGYREPGPGAFFGRYVVDQDDSLPLHASTAHGQMSAWGQGRYMVSPGGNSFLNASAHAGFSYAFDFPPQLVSLVEGETNSTTIRATVPPATFEGTLFAADEVSPQGTTIYRPVGGKEIRFVMHETARELFQPGYEVQMVTTDEDGDYRIQLPPGCYGIEIPGMPGYWGCRIEGNSLTGWGASGPWPYAHRGGWSEDAVTSPAYNGLGFGANSGAYVRMNLYVNKMRYAVRVGVTVDSPMVERLLFLSPDGSVESKLNVNDCLESETMLRLSADGGVSPVQRHVSGICAIWTSLDGGNYVVTGEDHNYLRSTSDVAFSTFDWGSHPGAPPSSEPPYGDALDATPLPMQLYRTRSYKMQSVTEPATPPSVDVTYSIAEEPYYNTVQRIPLYVAYKDAPTNAIYLPDIVDRVDRDRAQTYYISFEDEFYAVSGDDNSPAVDLRGGRPPDPLPLPKYSMDVVGVDKYYPDEEVQDVPFEMDGTAYTAPEQFGNLTSTVSIAWSSQASSPWIGDSIRYQVNPTNHPAKVLTTLFCSPRVGVIGTVLNAASGKAVSGALVQVIKADGAGGTVVSGKTASDGAFELKHAYTRGAYLLRITAPGYLPYCERVVLRDIIAGTGGTPPHFIANAGARSITPIAVNAAKDGWNRRGSVLHGVRAAGNAEQPKTSKAVELTVTSSATIPPQSFDMRALDTPDGQPGARNSRTLTDAVTEVWVVDSRYKDDSGEYRPYLTATETSYYPEDEKYMPPATDPEKTIAWLNNVSADRQVIMKLRPSEPGAAVSATGVVSVAGLRPGRVLPVLVARTRSGACGLLALDTNLIESVALPSWLAFAADVFAGAAAVQSAYGELKETYASKVPDGKLSALPKLSGGISEDDDYLTYAYGLGIEWEEGVKAPGTGGLSLGPGMLGLKFEADATIGFEGERGMVTFEVGGRVTKEDIDLKDFAPTFLDKIGVEGKINKVGGTASTLKKKRLGGGKGVDLELVTRVGTFIDLELKYPLVGIAGKIPYVGPLLVVADKTEALKLYGRLDAGGRVENMEVWRTIEPDRAAQVGEPVVDPDATRTQTPRPDDLLLTSTRHCFGGQGNRKIVNSNQFLVGVAFAAGFEGSAAGDRVNLQAGIEITGGTNDQLVAGEPSLVITPNTFGDWPPVKRVQGDVNAYVKAKLDVLVTEIEKKWTINLARIDHQFTTESLITMADMSVEVTKKAPESTEFTGVRPVAVRYMPRGASYAILGDMLVFGMYDRGAGRTDLVVSLANGNGYDAPTTIATDVEGLGLIRLAETAAGQYLLVWEERPSFGEQSEAYSVLHSARYNGAWQTGQTVADLNSYLADMAVFASTSAVSLVYLRSPENHSKARTSIRAAAYDAGTDTWGRPVTVQPLAERRGAALACAGWRSPEPGRIAYVPGDAGIQSIYWDGARSAVPGGNLTRAVTGSASRLVAACSGGTNEVLYVTSLGEDGILDLHRYVPDPLREPSNPAYDWNGRDPGAMWPHVTTLGTAEGPVDELANGWMPDCGRLLTVWSQFGVLRGSWVDPAAATHTADVEITHNTGGSYRDVSVLPLTGSFARVAARFTSQEASELRVFLVECDRTVADEDVDGDGLRDSLEQALVDAKPDDAVQDIRDVSGAADFDGDGIDNATEWANGTDAHRASSFPRLGVSIEVASRYACEDGPRRGSAVVVRADADPAVSNLTVHFDVTGTAMEGVDYAALARTVTIPSNMTYATIDVLPLADDAIEENETVELTLVPNAGYVLGLETQAVIMVVETLRGQWSRERFTPAQLANPAISGPSADPDGDGIPNYLEYALGLDPLETDPCELRISPGDNTLDFSFTRDPEADDALITMIRSTNLLDSAWDQSDATCIWRESRPDGLEDVYYRVTSDASGGFFRLRVEDIGQ